MDKQLSAVDAEDAAKRYAANRPVTLKQLAVALGIGYDQVRGWADLDGFPYSNRLIFPEDFKLWRQRRFGLSGRGAAKSSSSREDRPRSTADKSDAPAPTRGSRGASRTRAALLLEQAS